MQVKFSDQSVRDLHDIADYLYEAAGLEIANHVNDEIYRVIYDVIAENPHIGPKVPFGTDGLRFFPAGKYNNYHIYYTVENDIVVIRVLYGSRDIASILQPED